MYLMCHVTRSYIIVQIHFTNHIIKIEWIRGIAIIALGNLTVVFNTWTVHYFRPFYFHYIKHVIEVEEEKRKAVVKLGTLTEGGKRLTTLMKSRNPIVTNRYKDAQPFNFVSNSRKGLTKFVTSWSPYGFVSYRSFQLSSQISLKLHKKK